MALQLSVHNVLPEDLSLIPCNHTMRFTEGLIPSGFHGHLYSQVPHSYTGIIHIILIIKQISKRLCKEQWKGCSFEIKPIAQTEISSLLWYKLKQFILLLKASIINNWDKMTDLLGYGVQPKLRQLYMRNI